MHFMIWSHAGLMVHIETDPPSEPYPAATWIGLSCHISGNTSMVTFNWTYLCSTQNPPTVVLSFTNRINVNQTDVYLRSTPTSCIDMMMCNASDLSGNTGFATWRFGKVTGKKARMCQYLASYNITIIPINVSVYVQF